MLQGDLRVARVIARPFTGSPGQFQRTPDRKDYAVDPPICTVLERLSGAGKKVFGVGKIEDIFNQKGLTDRNHTHNNSETLAALLEIVKTSFNGLVFANCIDFDMVYGHRNDVKGFANALVEADRKLAELSEHLADDELLMITGDHGCDPTTTSTDHSREYVPLLVCGPKIKNDIDLGVRTSFTDLGATIEELLLGGHKSVGISFAGRLF
jgi:phosphopentomutase